MSEVSVSLFGPLDALLAPGNRAAYLILALVVVNFVTRKLASDRYRRQAEAGGEDALSRHPLHVASTWALILSCFYYLTLEHHSGIVISVLVLGMFVADFFEFESRKVEAREGLPLERPKGSMTISVVVLLYAAYIAVFFLLKGYWNLVV